MWFFCLALREKMRSSKTGLLMCLRTPQTIAFVTEHSYAFQVIRHFYHRDWELQKAPGSVPGLMDGDPRKYPFSRFINRLNCCGGPYGSTPLVAAYVSVVALCVVATIVIHEKASEANGLMVNFLWLVLLHGLFIGAHVWYQTHFMRHDSSRRIYGLCNVMIFGECVWSIAFALLIFDFIRPCVFLPTNDGEYLSSGEQAKYLTLARFQWCLFVGHILYSIILGCLYKSSRGARFCIRLG